MTIPDKAIEAALDAFWGPDWRDVPGANLPKRMRAALAAAEQAMWEPIDEDTPQAEIIVTDEISVGEAHYTDGEWRWLGNDPTDHWGEQIFPTYWRPLPPPPETKK